MKYYLLILSISFLFSSNFNAQIETFTHCHGNEDSIFIEKIDETTSGDTLIKSFRYVYNHYDPDTYFYFDYYFFNDSVFSKFDENYYIIGDNNAQVGDIWHPLRYIPFFEADTMGYECSTINMQVNSISEIFIDGVPTNYFHLIDIESDTGDERDYGFLANIGATQGGPLYNFIQLYHCYYVFDGPPNSLFKSYTNSNFTYHEVIECPIVPGSIGLNENSTDFPSITRTQNMLKVENTDKQIQLSIYDVLGREVITTNEYLIDISHLKGVYLIKLEYENQQRIIKFYF